MWATCPYQAWKTKESQGRLLDVGDAIHKLGEDWVKHAIENQIPSEDIASDIVDALGTVRPDIQPFVIKAARFFAEQVSELRLPKILGVELQIDDACKTGIKNMEGVPYKLTACLDLLQAGTNSLHVWDWKTGFKRRNKEDTYNDFQARFDCNILWKMYPEIDIIHWWYLETFWGTKSYARFDRNEEYPSLPHLNLERQIEGQIFEAIKLWSDGCHDAWPETKKCSWCSVIQECPYANEDARKIEDDPKAFIDRMIVLKAAYDDCIKTAKNYLQKTGPIKGTEMIFEWRPSKKFTPKLYKSKDEEESEEESP